MKSDIPTINVNLFLKNIKNLPAILTAFNMLEIKYFSQNSFYQIINKAKIQFLGEIKPTLKSIEIISERYFTTRPDFNSDQLFLIKKIVASFYYESDELLKITKEKLDEIVDFINLIKDNFYLINFSEADKERIRQEILIVEKELSKL